MTLRVRRQLCLGGQMRFSLRWTYSLSTLLKQISLYLIRFIVLFWRVGLKYNSLPRCSGYFFIRSCGNIQFIMIDQSPYQSKHPTRYQDRDNVLRINQASAAAGRIPLDRLVPYQTQKVEGGIDQGSIRQGFKKKVYGLVVSMLVLTFLWVVLNLSSAGLGKFVLENAWLSYTCAGLLLPIIIIVICCRDAIKFPVNYICLIAYTLLQSYLVGFVCDSYVYRWDYSLMPDKVKLILTAFGMTCLVVLLLSLVAAFKCIDMTRQRNLMVMGALGLLLMAPMMIILQPLRGFLSWLALVIYSLYIIYDIQMISGDCHNSFGVDDWVIASIQVYTDIIQVFLRILQILAD